MHIRDGIVYAADGRALGPIHIAGGAPGVDPTPSMGRFKNAGVAFAKGVGAGLASGVAMSIVGPPIGQAAGAIVMGAVYGGTDGRTVALTGGMEAAEMLFVGGDA